MTWELRKIGGSGRLCLLLLLAVLCSGVLFALHATGDAGGYTVSALRHAFVNQFFKNEDIPLWLLVFGSLGQIIFTLRFVYQWLYSRRKNESVLPLGFWLISLTGSLIIVAYALYRRDPVLILGQSTGLLVYSRNIYLLQRNK